MIHDTTSVDCAIFSKFMRNESRKIFPRLFKLIICNPLLYFPFIIRHPWPSLFFLGLKGVDCLTNHAKDTFKTFKATYMHVTLRILNLCSCLELQKYIEPLIAFKVQNTVNIHLQMARKLLRAVFPGLCR